MIVPDLETTGTNITKDKIVEIAMTKLDKQFNIISTLHLFINPEMHIPEEASAIHGITDEDVKGALPFDKRAQVIFDFIKDEEYFCGYNVKFDGMILERQLNEAGFEFDIMKKKLIDELKIWNTHEPHTLTGAMKRFLNIEHEDAHTATGDVQAVIDLFYPMLVEFGVSDLTLDELSEKYGLSNDMVGGRAERDENGDLILKFGTKYMGRKVKNLPMGDLDWLLYTSNIDAELKYLIHKEMKRLGRV